MAAIDEALAGLELGNIAFNAPRTVEMGGSAEIQLLLSLKRSIEELQERLTAAGEREGAQIRVSDQMEARLTGLRFTIQAITPEIQAVSGVEDTQWKWEVEPTKVGLQQLHLTLSALLSVDGQERVRTIRTFSREIDVRSVRVPIDQRILEFLSNNWKWLWTAIVVPVVVWGVRRRRQSAATGGT